MKRTNYLNGDAITLISNGCDGCNLVTIHHGALMDPVSHEYGCPEAWKDQLYECRWCGSDFHPTHKEQNTCDESCRAAYSGDYPGGRF